MVKGLVSGVVWFGGLECRVDGLESRVFWGWNVQFRGEFRVWDVEFRVLGFGGLGHRRLPANDKKSPCGHRLAI